MNLEESNQFVEKMEQNNQKRKTILTVIIFCAILIIILLILIGYLKKIDSKTLKLYIDDKQIAIPADLIKEENDEKYFNIKKLATLLGYSYQQGEYNKYNEDSNSCYINNDYIVVAMTAEQNKINKYLKNDKNNSISDDENTEKNENEIGILVKSEDNSREEMNIEKTIESTEKGLYTSFVDVEKIFNIKFDNSNPYQMKFYSIDYLIKYYSKIISRSGYSQISNYYENLIAMIDDMLIVGDGSKWGVLSLKNGNEIISLKYEDIVYRQDSQEFLVFAENSVGIVSVNGKTIIKPTEYDDIKYLEKIKKIDEQTNEEYEERLYLVEKNKKYGIVNDKSEVIAINEYDSIGIKNIENFRTNDIISDKILFGKCIPVEYNGKFGIININGEEKLKCVFDSFGYEEDDTNSDSSELVGIENVLIIPEQIGIKGIVVKKDNSYGIYDAELEKLIVPCVFSKIYIRPKGNSYTYFIEYNGQEMNLEEYLIENELKSIE